MNDRPFIKFRLVAELIAPDHEEAAVELTSLQSELDRVIGQNAELSEAEVRMTDDSTAQISILIEAPTWGEAAELGRTALGEAFERVGISVSAGDESTHRLDNRHRHVESAGTQLALA